MPYTVPASPPIDTTVPYAVTVALSAQSSMAYTAVLATPGDSQRTVVVAFVHRLRILDRAGSAQTAIRRSHESDHHRYICCRRDTFTSPRPLWHPASSPRARFTQPRYPSLHPRPQPLGPDVPACRGCTSRRRPGRRHDRRGETPGAASPIPGSLACHGIARRRG